MPSSARSTRVDTSVIARGLQLVGGVDDGALARIVDQRVLHIQRVRRDDTLDEVRFPRAVQRQSEPAGEDLAALLDEGGQRLVDVLFAGEAAVPDGGKPRVARQLMAPGP